MIGERALSLPPGALKALRMLFFFAALMVGQRAMGVSLMAAGAGGDGWLLSYDEEQQSGWIIHLPANAPAGVYMPALDVSSRTEGFAEAPEAMTAWGDTLFLVFPAEQNPSARVETPLRRVRQLRVSANPAVGYYTYDPPNRLAALPGLPGEEQLLSLAAGPDGLCALLTDRKRAGGTTYRLLWKRQTSWVDVTLPPDLYKPEALLGTRSSFISIIGVTRDNERRIWIASPPVEPAPVEHAEESDVPSADAADSADAPTDDSEVQLPLEAVWTSRAFGIDPQQSKIIAIEGAIFGVTEVEGARVRLDLDADGQVSSAGLIDLRATTFVALSVGADIALAYPPTRAAEAPELTVISPLTTGVIYDEVARRVSPVTENDLRFLGLLFGAVLLTVGLFILKPRVATRETVDFPPYTSLAEPIRRVAAVLVDFVPCAVIAAIVFKVSVIEVVTGPFQQTGPEGVWPAILGLAVLFAHSSLSEWIFGKTIGKLTLSCRTISVTGEKPTLRQAIWRNAIKALCPPLIIVLFLDPRGRHPGDLVSGTLVIIDLPIPTDPEETDEIRDRLSLESDPQETEGAASS